MTRAIAIAYAVLLYGFIFLPVAVLVLFSFQGTLSLLGGRSASRSIWLMTPGVAG